MSITLTPAVATPAGPTPCASDSHFGNECRDTPRLVTPLLVDFHTSRAHQLRADTVRSTRSALWSALTGIMRAIAAIVALDCSSTPSSRPSLARDTAAYPSRDTSSLQR